MRAELLLASPRKDEGHRAQTEEQGLPFIDRQVQRIANARSVTIGLAIVFLALAIVGAIVMRIVDHHDFPTLGLAAWWSLQTVTTVGYGDVVPTTDVGRIIGGVELVIGVSFIAFLTAGVTSTVIERGSSSAASVGARAGGGGRADDHGGDRRSRSASRANRVATGRLSVSRVGARACG